jgi:NAD(P)H-dependent FMN reductase
MEVRRPPDRRGPGRNKAWNKRTETIVLLQVITGTTRQGRFSERVAAWALGRLRDHGGFDVEAIDLRDHRLPFFDAEMAPARTGGVYEDDEVTRFGATVARADGFVILTGEYNHGYPAVLKNAMDSTFVEWRRKPISFVGWGNVGGARAIEQLRQVAVEFEMAPLRWAVHILPDVLIPLRQADDPDDDSLLASLDPRLTMLADDMVWWMHALATARAASG